MSILKILILEAVGLQIRPSQNLTEPNVRNLHIPLAAQSDLQSDCIEYKHL